MAIRLSNGLKSALYGQFGIQAMMQYGLIEVYSGSQPVTASEAPTGTLLGTITNNGDTHVSGSTQGGLRIDQNTSGQLIANGTWRLTGVDTGTAGWWRWKWNAFDDDSVSLYYPRMDGEVGNGLVLASTSITPSTDVEIGSFVLRFLES